MDVYRLALTVLVMAGVVVAILLFEKRRAQGIERDTRDMARGRPEDASGGSPDDGSDDRGPGR
ncbi:hypothetical protein [Nocardioides ganghwensis]|jgi:hypothetical protein|uniref:Uncharacterized protein n=1 Tax=Nocardioides ganghwensis TaxID=252230 RepID=A0A4Q2S8T6_9ACTN|nr:hypothetical protein [Nocardioides ganghwensis]MBD3945563.1 hypothetical protein [Nocardioides ganghwensis]RYB99603.1 hypothetical protein EUA07_15735 [Nocardioides ganghwensis]